MWLVIGAHPNIPSANYEYNYPDSNKVHPRIDSNDSYPIYESSNSIKPSPIKTLSLK